MEYECVVLAEKGIQYGKMIPNPDPTKPPINLVRLYEKGEHVLIDEKDFVDFDSLNKARNQARGMEIEVSYRKTGNVAKPVTVPDLEALKAQIKAELKQEMEAAALRGHNPATAMKGK